MLTKNDAKLIKSLQLKKFRTKEQAFILEGAKNVLELLSTDFQILNLYVTPAFFSEHKLALEASRLVPNIVGEKELQAIGTFKSNNAALALVKMPQSQNVPDLNDHILAFENLQDPGNLGTIIRTADWYGFKQIVCSDDSVDLYNPKVISATMGSYSRVKVCYLDLQEFIARAKLPLYGTTLQGKNLHDASFDGSGIFLFGNESKGISDDLRSNLDHQLKIQGYGGAESLNVAVATAVLCDNLRRISL